MKTDSNLNLGIHARMSDDGENPLDRATKIEWLVHAIEKVQDEKEVLNGYVVCFTDTPSKVQVLLKYFPQIRIVGQELSPLDSLLALSKFKNLVLAESTFSFWACELSSAEFIISSYSNKDLFRPTKKYLYIPKKV